MGSPSFFAQNSLKMLTLQKFSIIMKKILIFFCFCLMSSIKVDAQLSKSAMLNGVDMSNLSPSDIPSESTLRQMGVSEEQIKMLMSMKNKDNSAQSIVLQAKDSTAKPTKSYQDTLRKITARDTTKKLGPAMLYGQDYFRNRSIQSFDMLGITGAPDHYILSSGDQVSISIWGYADYNNTFVLDPDGFITSRETGRIYLKGIKLADARKLLKSRFAAVMDLANSQLSIVLTSARIINVNIVGEVFSPGSYSIPALSSAFNALTIANGTTDIGSVRTIYIRRGGKTIRTLDLYDFLLNPLSDQDFFLENDDYIIVPPAEKVVNLAGEVRRPFSYELLANEGLKEAIKYAGGIKATGYIKSIQVKRVDGERTFYIDLKYDSLLAAKKNALLLDGDSVFVKPIPNFPEGFVDITGAIRVPGRYSLKKQEHISDLIKLAQGVMDESYLARAYLIRRKDDLTREYISFNLEQLLANEHSAANLELQSYDIVQIFSKTRFMDPDSITLFGSVRNPGRYLFGDGLSLKDAIYLTGGFRKEAANSKIEVSRLSNIGKGSTDTSRVIALSASIAYDLSIEDKAGDFKLQPFDQIFIRRLANFEYQQNVYVGGEVLFPGMYSKISKDEKLFDVLARAGGLTQFAFPEATRLYRSQDKIGYLFLDLKREDLTNPKSESNYVLQEGDTITIPRINELVAVKGAIRYPGIDSIGQINAPFFKGSSARYYIANYGIGFAKGAARSKTYVVLPGGFIKRTVSLGVVRLYPRVRQGSTVVAVYKLDKNKKDRKQSEPVNWNKTIENITIKATAVLTIWLLITQINK